MMKKLLLTLTTGLVMLTGVAQTSITYQSLGIYPGTPCEGESLDLYPYAYTTGYNQNDSIDFITNMGNGDVITERLAIWDSLIISNYSYPLAGSYTIHSVAIAPDGKSDTLIQTITVSTCGNVSGNVYADDNNNCTKDAGENGIANNHVAVYDNNTGNYVKSVSTDANGDYDIPVPTGGSYYLTSNNWGYTTTCPNSGQIAVTSLPSTGNDFGKTCNNGNGWYGTPQNPNIGSAFRPGFCLPQHMAFTSHCDAFTGSVTMIPMSDSINIGSFSTAPDVTSGDTVTWNFSSFEGYFYTYFSACTDTVVAMDTTASEFCYHVIVRDGQNNVITDTIYCLPIVNSWDPNMITVSPKGEGLGGEIYANQDLYYTIHFQNTGSAEAYNVYLYDTLPSTLDVASMRVISYSHDVSYSVIDDNVLRFEFANIMLPDSNANEPESHGYVTFGIDQQADLPIGTQIFNEADIYFDFNPAVETNQVVNTIVEKTTNAVAEKEMLKLKVFPNPARDFVQVVYEGEPATLTMINTMGAVVKQQPVRKGISTIKTADMPKGVYVITIQNSKQSSHATLFIE